MIRFLHIVSSAVMFGVGVGAFWFMLTTVRSGNLAAIAVTTRNAVLAEWFIAVPVSIVQPATAYLLLARWQRLALGAFAGVLLLFWLMASGPAGHAVSGLFAFESKYVNPSLCMACRERDNRDMARHEPVDFLGKRG